MLETVRTIGDWLVTTKRVFPLWESTEWPQWLKKLTQWSHPGLKGFIRNGQSWEIMWKVLFSYHWELLFFFSFNFLSSWQSHELRACPRWPWHLFLPQLEQQPHARPFLGRRSSILLWQIQARHSVPAAQQTESWQLATGCAKISRESTSRGHFVTFLSILARLFWHFQVLQVFSFRWQPHTPLHNKRNEATRSTSYASASLSATWDCTCTWSLCTTRTSCTSPSGAREEGLADLFSFAAILFLLLSYLQDLFLKNKNGAKCP